MAVLATVEFVLSEGAGAAETPYMIWPQGVPVDAAMPHAKKHVASGRRPTCRNARVGAAEGHGDPVDEFLIKPNEDQITHLVVRGCHPLGQRGEAIPGARMNGYPGDPVQLMRNRR
jgi:hypothetical protein